MRMLSPPGSGCKKIENFMASAARGPPDGDDSKPRTCHSPAATPLALGGGSVYIAQPIFGVAPAAFR